MLAMSRECMLSGRCTCVVHVHAVVCVQHLGGHAHVVCESTHGVRAPQYVWHLWFVCAHHSMCKCCVGMLGRGLAARACCSHRVPLGISGG